MKHKGKDFLRTAALVVVFLATIFSATYLINRYVVNNSSAAPQKGTSASSNAASSNSLGGIASQVLPAQGFVMPAKWGSFVKELVQSGALNISFLANVLQKYGQPLNREEVAILNGTSNRNITINASSAAFMLYVLWAIGINNNNTIINNGPLMHYGNPNGFASTGGYGPVGRLQIGKLNLISLTSQQQAVANYTAFNSYRPCCNNPTGFPDCNHGAAALGLIELMASQNANATIIFNALKEFNSFQFPQQYTNIAVYLNATGSSFSGAPSQEVMSFNISSGNGAASIQNYISSHGLAKQAGGGQGCSA